MHSHSHPVLSGHRENSWAPHLRSPCPGEDRCGGAGWAAMLPCHTAPGHGRAPGMAGHRDGAGSRTMPGAEVWEACHVSCRQSNPPAPSPARLCPWWRAERARGGGEAGIAWGWRGCPSFLLRMCAKACWGRRWGEEALAGFQLRARQPGSAGVAVPLTGPWAGHPVAGQGSNLKSGFRGWPPASS